MYAQHSKRLISSLLLMEIPEQKMKGKMEMIAISRYLMPGGRPRYTEVVKYPMVKDLAKSEGNNTMLKLLLLIIRDFCNSVNVVRNMNDDQMIESASMLLDECDNFRLEDYVMMFSMAKRGDLVKIFDRLDISVITAIMDEYWIRRKRAAKEIQEQPVERLDSLGNTVTKKELLHPQDAKLMDSGDRLAGMLGDLKKLLTQDMETIPTLPDDYKYNTP